VSIGTPFANKGSQRWLQIAVDRAPHVLNAPIAEALGLSAGDTITWLSPRRDDRFNEYRDGAALAKCGISPKLRPLTDFWPKRGPVWDGLARTSGGEAVLVEAKAHIPELVSPRSRASEPALGKIAASMRSVQKALAPQSVDVVDWTGTFYQYANRIAHLYFLREDNGEHVHLVNIYFVNAPDVAPTSRAEWEGALKVVECYLGVGRHRLSKYMHKIFIETAQLIGLDQQGRA